MNRYLIIVNPISGRGNGARIRPALEARLEALGLPFEIVYTKRRLHAADLARTAGTNGFDTVVAVGGDGTANEVINGLLQAQDERGESGVAMGVLAAGRGNDFAYSMDMPAALDAASAVLARRRLRRIDVGHVVGGLFPHGRYFGNSLGIGFDAVVSFEAVKMTRLTGFPSYLVAVLKTVFLYYHAPQVLLQNGTHTVELSALMVSIMNGQRQGGAFFMAPTARNDDGLLDLCIAREVSKARVFTLLPHFFRGSQFGQAEIVFDQCEKLTVTALRGVLPAHADGETLCVDGTKLEVRLLPGQLDVIAGP